MIRSRLPLVALAASALAACAPEPPDTPEAAETTPPPIVRDGVVPAADGVPIVYDALGTGETTLLFVHCWACDRTFWREQLDLFAESYRVIALDLPGHGQSGTEREQWTLAGLADDLRTVVEALDLERVILVGHSMGGPVSVLAAPQIGDRLLGVACVDTLHDAGQPWDREAAAPMIAMFENDFEGANRQIVPMLFPEGADPELVGWVVERALATDRRAAVGLMKDFPELRLDEAMAAAGVPIRCVNAGPLGEMIPTTAIEGNRAFADFDAQLIDGVGHYLQLERPGEVNEALAAIFAELAAPESDPGGDG